MKNPARIISLVFLSSGIILLLTPRVLANISVNVSGNGEGSKANVNIRSNSSSTTNSTSTNSNHTLVKINVNGEEKTYSSNKNEDVSMESSDGSVKVNINNSSTKPIIMQSQSIKNDTKVHVKNLGKKAEVHVNVKTGGKNVNEIKKDTLFGIKAFFEKLFSGLFSVKNNS